MRKDMKKVILQRARSGGNRDAKKLGARLDPRLDDEDRDTGPRHVKSSAGGPLNGPNWEDKDYKLYLAPLKRFLHSRTGRKWDKVYAEIRSQADPRQSDGIYLLDHLKRLVQTNCFMQGGNVVYQAWGRTLEPDGFYVHPETGILCPPVPRRYERRPPPITRVQRDDSSWWELASGIWYRTEAGARSRKQCSKKELKTIEERIARREGCFGRKSRYDGSFDWIPVEN